MGRSQNSNKTLGQNGEEAALKCYLKDGFRLVEKNWRCRLGEIDLIVRKKRSLVFVEVKTAEEFASVRPIENITPKKIKKLKRLMELYSALELPYLKKIESIQLDIAEVLHAGEAFKVKIIPNILLGDN